MAIGMPNPCLQENNGVRAKEHLHQFSFNIFPEALQNERGAFKGNMLPSLTKYSTCHKSSKSNNPLKGIVDHLAKLEATDQWSKNITKITKCQSIGPVRPSDGPPSPDLSDATSSQQS
ncbi:hypothetical protein ACFE04_015624 [Oxalis oulophora]